jgi:general secretion pathway protein F
LRTVVRYQVRALDEATQQLVSEQLEAFDEADARRQLRARSLTPLALRAAGALPRLGAAARFPVTLLAQELQALVGAGLSLIESLEALAEKEADTAIRVVLQRLIAEVRAGRRFSAALRAQGALFPPLFIGIVEAAENTGELPSALERYVDYAGKLAAVRQRVVSAAIYPAILLTAGAAVSLFLLAWVVPRFAAVYRGSGRTLPWASQRLLDWGDLAGRHPQLLALVVAGLAVALYWGLREVARRGAWSRVARLVPGASRWVELLTLSRLYLTLGLLLRGGLPVQGALELARSVLPPERAAAVDRARHRIAEGWALSRALDGAGLGTPISLRFLRAGERSGQLATMLHRAALYHDAETTRWVERFSRAFEPLLMAAIGLVVGILVLLLYLPIFELAGSIG